MPKKQQLMISQIMTIWMNILRVISLPILQKSRLFVLYINQKAAKKYRKDRIFFSYVFRRT